MYLQVCDVIEMILKTHQLAATKMFHQNLRATQNDGLDKQFNSCAMPITQLLMRRNFSGNSTRLYNHVIAHSIY